MVPSLIMLHLYDKIPIESFNLVRSKLKGLDKIGLAKVVLALPSVKLYNVAMVFWIGSFFLGLYGVGRFMIGDRLSGFIKLSLLVFSFFLILLGSVLFGISFALGIAFLAIGVICILGAIVWWVVDLFIISTKTRRVNLEKILMIFKL